MNKLSKAFLLYIWYIFRIIIGIYSRYVPGINSCYDVTVYVLRCLLFVSFCNNWTSRILLAQVRLEDSLWFKKVNPGLITSEKIVKSLFALFWIHFQKRFYCIGYTDPLFFISQKWSSHFAFIFLSCKCIFKIPWTYVNDKFVNWATCNCLTVNRASVYRFCISMLLLVVVVLGRPVWAASLSCCCPFQNLVTHLQIAM